MAMINGEQIPSADGRTVSQYLEILGRNASQVAVLLDGDILPKDKYAQTVLGSESEVEIIGFVGGG